MPVSAAPPSSPGSSSAWYVPPLSFLYAPPLISAQILILIFAEVLGLYGMFSALPSPLNPDANTLFFVAGLIVALIMNTKSQGMISAVRPPLLLLCAASLTRVVAQCA
jgi:F0F1-type ATP synthase membrane subunit c/vacuolar-type H+-ATPase subunit K